jgi:hypothetical protein
MGHTRRRAEVRGSGLRIIHDRAAIIGTTLTIKPYR